MATRRPSPKRSLKERTPLAEWIAAGLGLVLTLGVLGYLVREGLSGGDAPPALTAQAEATQRVGGSFLVPLVVRNASNATAADVEVSGTLERGGQVVEERRASFAYVPGRGEVHGGLLFQHDPAGHQLEVSVQGYEAP